MGASEDRRHALGRLIDEAADSQGLTMREVARRSTLAGYPMSPQNLSRIRRDPVVSIAVGMVRAIAAGLAVPAESVVAAAAASMGVVAAKATPESAIAADPSLTTAQRRALLGTLVAFREAPQNDDSLTL